MTFKIYCTSARANMYACVKCVRGKVRTRTLGIFFSLFLPFSLSYCFFSLSFYTTLLLPDYISLPLFALLSLSLSVSSPPLPLPYPLTYRFTASQRLKSSRLSSEYLDDLCTLIEWFRPKKTNTWRQILRSREDFHCSLKALKIRISPRYF